MQAADICMKRQGYDNRDSIDNIDESELENVRENVYLHVWLPVITEYVEWVLDEAIASGKKRLYFLARDGYMMYLMAQKLAGARESEIELRYLKVSRFAIRNAEYYFIGRDALDTLCMGGIDITFEKIMKRAGLTGEEALHIAELAERTESYKTALNYRRLRKLKEELSQIEELFIYIKRHSEACYKTTAAYLRQEGLLDEVPYALVDSGWAGSLQLSIQRVLAHETSRDIRLQGYYFGIYERPKGTDRGQYKTFYFSEKHIRRKVRFSNCLFETVVSAPEGTTCRYEAVKEYIAVESGMRNPNAEAMECFVKLLSEYAAVYTELIVNSGAAENVSAGKRSAVCRKQKKRVRFVERLLSQMMGNPTRLESEALGEMLFCDDVLELQLQPVAAIWDKEELRKNSFINKLLIKLNLKSVGLHESAWPEGSITRLGIKIKKNIRQERLYKGFMYLRKAVRR